MDLDWSFISSLDTIEVIGGKMKLVLAEPKYLKDSIAILSELVTDVNLLVDKDKIEMIAADPANVSMVIYKLLSSAFAEYDVDKETQIAVNLDSLKQVLRRVKPADIIEIDLDGESSKLRLTLKGDSTRVFNIALLNLEDQEQKIPKLNFPLTISTTSAYFDEAVEGISGLSVGRGVFGEHWNWGDDARTTISTISKDPNLNPTEYYQRFVGPATGFGKIYEEKILPAAANAPLRLKATESIKNYFPYQTPVYPASVRYTKAENDRMVVLTNDIDTYVGQMIAKFVMGEESLDKWDDYVGNLKKLNIDELIKIKQDAYDRWTNIK